MFAATYWRFVDCAPERSGCTLHAHRVLITAITRVPGYMLVCRLDDPR